MFFDTTYGKEKDDSFLFVQLKKAEEYLPIINEAAIKYHIQPCIIAGLGSRESAWGLTLNPKGPEGIGDNGHGKGLMQLDDRWHEFARTGPWQDPHENILYGCSILANNLGICKRRLKSTTREFIFPWCTDDKDLLRAALAGYNAGPSRVISCISAKGDIDELTSGGNYSADVLQRAGWFQLQGWTDGEIMMADLLTTNC